MNALRRLAVALCASLMVLALISLAWAHVAAATLRNRETVKGWLNESGFYEKIVPGLLENVKVEEGSIPVNDPEIIKVADQAFSPAFLKENVEKVLDGTYAWLEGETEKPEFSVDLTAAKQRLADGIGNYATTKAASLPTCTAEQLQALQQDMQDGFDVFSATCLPPGMSPQQAGSELRAQVLGSEEFLSDTTLDGSDLTDVKNEAGQPVTEGQDVKNIPKAFQAGKAALWVAAITAALTAAAVLLLSSTRRAGLKRVGIGVTTAGVFVGLGYVLAGQGTSWLNQRAQDLGGDSNVGQELAANIASAVGRDVGNILGWYALAYLLIGTAAILFAVFFRRQKQAVSESSDQLAATGKTENPAPATDSQAKEKKQPKQPPKIQL